MSRLTSSLIIRLLVTVVVLGYIASRIDLADAARVVTRINLATCGLLAVMLAGDRILAASRWLTLVWASGIELPAMVGVRLFLISSFLGSFLPAGVGGDVARTWELASRTQRGSEALAVVAVDRWLGLTSVLLLGTVGVASSTQEVDPRVSVALYALLIVVILGGLVGAFADFVVTAVLPKKWAERRAWAAITRLAGVVRRFRRRWPAIALVVGLSFAVQVLRVVMAWLIGVGLAVDVPLSYYFVVMPIGIVAILLPISIGGFGPAQGVIIWMLRPLGVPDEISFAMSTLYILVGFVANLPGAVIFLRYRH